MIDTRAPGFIPDGGESHSPNVLWAVCKWSALLWGPPLFCIGFGTLWPLLAWVAVFVAVIHELIVEG